VTIKGAIDGWRFIGCTIGRGKQTDIELGAVRQLLDAGAQAYAQRADQGMRVGGRLTHPRYLLERRQAGGDREQREDSAHPVDHLVPLLLLAVFDDAQRLICSAFSHQH
jgi:hypothetical protein